MNIKLENLEKDYEERQDEFISTITSRKRLIENPKYKIKYYKKRYKNNLLLSGIYLLTILILYVPFILSRKESLIEGINLWVFILWLIILVLFILILINSHRYNKNLKEKKNARTKDKKVLVIDKDKVELQSKNEQSISINWNNIEMVLLNRYGILFLTKNDNTISIGIPIWYKEEVIDILKKYKKDNLIINKVEG